jgi:membrane fusion protein (multidrug efflux system)
MWARTVPPRAKKTMRYVIVIVGLLLLVGTLVLVKFSQISSLIATGKEAEKAGPPPEAVGSAVAELQSWEETLAAVGSVAGVKGVALSNDSPGIVKRLHFESGDVVKQGQLLVELDTSVERAQLASAKARRDLAEVTVIRSRALVAERVLARAQLDNDEAQLKTARTDFTALQAQIERRLVRAPFSGRVGVREVNLGQYLSSGTTLTVLEAIGGVFVDFTLPQQRLEIVSAGMPVRVTMDDATVRAAEGVISAVDPRIDDMTRSIRLRASVPNENDKLRPGMFVNVSVVMPKRAKVVIVPMTAVLHASYGDSVFVIEDKKPGSPGMPKSPSGKPVKIARQQFVRLGASRGDFVAIAQGVTPGQRVVSAGAFKLRNGSPVVIDNTIKPAALLNPRPENR